MIYYIQTYWPDKKVLEAEIIPLLGKKNGNIFWRRDLLWKGRICVPSTFQLEILGMLHDGQCYEITSEPFEGKMGFILIDAYTHGLEVVHMKDIS